MGRERRHGIGIPPPTVSMEIKSRGRTCKNLPISHAPLSKEGNPSTCKVTAGTWGPETHSSGLEHPSPAGGKNASLQDYQAMQDLREVNKMVVDIHPTLPNSYTSLSMLSPDQQRYTVLDSKDAFFS